MVAVQEPIGHGRGVCSDCDAAGGQGCAAHCGAPNRQAELYGPWCRRSVGWGTDHVGVGHCRLHLGNTESHRMRARQQMARKELAVHLRDLQYEPLGDPVVELADVAAKWRTLVEWATAHGAEVDDSGPWLELALDLGKEARRALEACGRLGLEERRVRLDEARLDLVAAVVMGVLRRLGQDPDVDEVQEALEATYAELGGD